MKTVRKVTVKAKLVKRAFNQADTLYKGGVIFMASFLIPMCVMVLREAINNPNGSTFGGF